MSSAIANRLLPLQLRLQATAASTQCHMDEQGLHCGPHTLSADTATLPAANLGIDFAPHPLQQQLGFMLFVAGPARPDPTLSRYLDQLAPAPGAWLYCGPHGSARFCRQIFDALFYLCGPILGVPDSTQARLPDWPHLLQKQWQLAEQLLALCQAYRHQHQDPPLAELASLLTAMATPPAQQDHFALALARLLQAGLQQQANCQQAFMLLWQRLQDGKPAKS